VDSAESLTSTQNAITSLLLASHHIAKGQPADFQITSSTQIASVVSQTTGTLTALLVSVAAISLVVGGIGIMNIMLVSVSERTREIGIRMSVGARRGAIRNQFLIEAVFLSGLGGLLGIAVGLFLGWVLTLLVGLPFEVALGWAALAFAVAALIGIVFGYYPAAQASRLDPITALRAD
jgi:putative ABC transport system permease protein